MYRQHTVSWNHSRAPQMEMLNAEVGLLALGKYLHVSIGAHYTPFPRYEITPHMPFPTWGEVLVSLYPVLSNLPSSSYTLHLAGNMLEWESPIMNIWIFKASFKFEWLQWRKWGLPVWAKTSAIWQLFPWYRQIHHQIKQSQWYQLSCTRLPSICQQDSLFFEGIQ